MTTAIEVVIEVFLVVCAGLIAVPAAILLVETLAAFLPARRAGWAAPAKPIRTAILIPAHNEAAAIGDTVRRLMSEASEGDRVIVIADNCSDQTAELARAAGARAIERTDPERRGKGYAIAFGLAELDADPPDVVVLVDADCRVTAGRLSTLAAEAVRTNRPIQAEYLLGVPPNPGPMAVVSGLAVLLRNRVRPRGLHRLGLPCSLTGSGMAFPWRVLRDNPDMGANLVEDLVMGIEMALRGSAPLLCPEVQIGSELPAESAAGLGQRKRWEHGQLTTLVTYGPRLLGAGLARGRIGLIALGLDLLVPPLALLVMMQMAFLALTALVALVGLTSVAPVLAAAVGPVLVGAAVALAWIFFGRSTLPLRHALFIPLYLAWKIPLYASLLLRGRQKTWERTKRSN